VHNCPFRGSDFVGHAVETRQPRWGGIGGKPVSDAEAVQQSGECASFLRALDARYVQADSAGAT
jgi:hypothetical protein